MWTRRTLLASGAAVLACRTARAADGYAEALAKACGAPVDPAAAHAQALREADRLRVRADSRLRRLGRRQGSVAERLAAMAADPRGLFSDDDAGRDAAVAHMNKRLADLRPRLAAAFGDLPIPQPIVRRPAPKDEARGGYREPPAYYVDLRNIRARPRWTLATVAYHETVPGHALQAAVPARPGPASFSEAWAIYAEQLAFDLGVYMSDGAGEVGYLQWRLFRIARMVADTGQGALGWSLDRAIAVMRELQGFDGAFITIEADAARIRAQPGAYAAQGLGALAIARARPRRRADWPAFHRAILADGAAPFAMLARGAGAAGVRETGR